MPNTYISKSGEVKKYDTKKYNAASYAKNKEKILEKTLHCVYCDVYYTPANKYNHMKSKKHLLVVAYANKINPTQPPEVLATRDVSNASNETLDKCELETK